MAKYSSRERRAYHSGMAYAAGRKGKKIPYKNEKNLKSFRNGYRKGLTVIVNYPDARGGKRK